MGSAGRLDSEAGNGLAGREREELLSPLQSRWLSQEKAHTASDGMAVASFGSWSRETPGGENWIRKDRRSIYGRGERRA